MPLGATWCQHDCLPSEPLALEPTSTTKTNPKKKGPRMVRHCVVRFHRTRPCSAYLFAARVCESISLCLYMILSPHTAEDARSKEPLHTSQTCKQQWRKQALRGVSIPAPAPACGFCGLIPHDLGLLSNPFHHPSCTSSQSLTNILPGLPASHPPSAFVRAARTMQDMHDNSAFC